MSLDDQASDHEEWHRELALREARAKVTPDYERIVCQGCDYAKEASKAAEKAKRSALDAQEGGDHYRKLGAYQPWEVLAKWMTPDELRGFAKGTVIAYLAREQDKGGRLDIKKAMHTLQIYLELTEGEQ